MQTTSYEELSECIPDHRRLESEQDSKLKDQIEEFLKDLSKEKRAIFLQALRALYRYLLRKNLVTVNPAAQVELAKLAKPLPKLVREKTVNALLDAEIDLDENAGGRRDRQAL